MKFLAEFALKVVLPRSDRRHVSDELDELHELHVERKGRKAADQWRTRQIWIYVFRALPTFWWRRPLGGFLGAMANRDGRLSSLDILRQDLRFAYRSFLRRPGFVLAAILILGVGIGATTTIFSVVDTILVRPLPYPDSGELVHFGGYGGIRPLLYTRWRDGLDSFESVEASWNVAYNLTGHGSPQRLRVSRVTPNLLSTLGAVPYLGRLFMQDDYRADASVGLLSYGFWQRQWGGNVSVMGTTIQVEGRPIVVAGVLDPGFHPPASVTGEEVDLWLPLLADAEGTATWNILSVVGRLRDGVGILGAQEELNAFHTHLAQELPDLMLLPDGSVRTTRLIPLQVASARGVAGSLVLLTWAVLLLLVIACANVANLLLAHGMARAREMALRGALGAGRRRLIRQLLTESVVLALAGGVAGVGLAYLSVRFFRDFIPADVPRIESLTVDPRVLIIALGISVATGLLFGMIPALHTSRRGVAEAMKEGGQASAGSRRGRKTRSVLVVAEIALALVLLTSSGLFFRSLVASTEVDLGFRSEELVTVPLHLGGAHDEATRQQFTRNVLSRVTALPGTEGAAVGLTAPFEYIGSSKCCIANELSGVGGREGAEPLHMAMTHPVTPGYFHTLNAEITRGREFVAGDEEGDGLVALINEPTAYYLFGTDDVVGRSIQLGGWGTFTLIGVVRGVRHWGVAEGIQAAVYIPYERWGSFSDIYHLIVRSSADLETLATGIRQAVWDVDPNLPVEEIVPMVQRVDASLVGQRFLSRLLGSFAFVALVLATGGIYASMLYTVGQRKQEMGIRIAMGAGGGQLVGLVLRNGLTLTAAGVVLGLAGSTLTARGLQSFLYGVALLDPVTLVAVTLVITGATVLACLVPAIRAARSDPMEALHVE